MGRSKVKPQKGVGKRPGGGGGEEHPKVHPFIHVCARLPAWKRPTTVAAPNTLSAFMMSALLSPVVGHRLTA